MSALTVAEVLDGAADLLEKPGAWGQHDYKPKEGCFCVLGAIRHVGKFNNDYNEPSHFFGDHIDPWMICDWNDQPHRTQAEVVEKLRQAAALAREQQA